MRLICVGNAIFGNGQVASHGRLAGYKRAARSRFYCIRQILMYTDCPRTERIEIFIVELDTFHRY